ncbi:hypothetical protein DINM_006533 [Dirofilaria immitis]|nr:hypothetical protein [Dirofilaria immitis]
MATLLLWINQAVFSSALIVISLVQCSSKKPQIKDLKDKDDKNETPKNVHIPIPAEQIKDKQEKSSSPEEKIKAAAEEQYSAAEAEKEIKISEIIHVTNTFNISSNNPNLAEKEKGRLREAEEKHIEEIKPKIMKRNAKEERIARGKETRGKGDYPTMDDDDDQKSKVNTNLEDVEEFRKNDDQKLMESGGVEEEKKKEKEVLLKIKLDDQFHEGEKKETDSKRDDAGGTGNMIRKAIKETLNHLLLEIALKSG